MAEPSLAGWRAAEKVKIAEGLTAWHAEAEAGDGGQGQSSPIDCTVDAAADIATLKQKLTAVEARIRENAKSTPTLDDLRERMAALLRDPPTLDTAARTLRATAQVMHGRALESANAAPEWPQLVAVFVARELGFVGMA